MEMDGKLVLPFGLGKSLQTDYGLFSFFPLDVLGAFCVHPKDTLFTFCKGLNHKHSNDVVCLKI